MISINNPLHLLIMYKDAEIIRNYQTDRGRRSENKPLEEFRKASGELKNRKSAWFDQEKGVSGKKQSLLNDLGTIPSLRVKVKEKDIGDTILDVFNRNHGISFVHFLNMCDQLIPDEQFDYKNRHSLLTNIYSRMATKFPWAEFEIDGECLHLRTSSQFAFSYVYIFDLATFHEDTEPYFRRIYYAFIMEVQRCINLNIEPLNGYPYDNDGFIENEFYICNEDEDFKKELMKKINEGLLIEKEILAESSSVSLDLDRDKSWLMDFFTYNGFPEKAMIIGKIIDIISNVYLDFNMVNMEENSEFIVFSTYKEPAFSDLVCEPMLSMVNESGLSTINEIVVTEECTVLDYSGNMSALYIDQILQLITELIIDSYYVE